MLTLLLIWLAVGIGLIWLLSERQTGSAGLPLAYFLGFSLIHVPGAIFYLDSNDTSWMATMTMVGFEQTIIGMVAFLVGVFFARRAFFASKRQNAEKPKVFTIRYLAAVDRLALIYLCAGLVVVLVLQRLISGIPSASSIVAPLGSLVIVGICLRFWVAAETRNGSKFWLTAALLPLLPLITVVQGGFLGFGTFWVLAIVAFLFAQSKQRFIYVLLAPIVFFLGLSLFVNYMAARNEIRQAVWHEQADLGTRLQVVAGIFDNFEWLDVSSSRQRELLERLNQNFFIGVAAERLEARQVNYASGATFGDVIIGLIPRAVWPDKPVVGGGGTVVHDFTGIEFAEGTSIGAGQVFEFYVNFGVLGVIGGFLVYGLVLGRTDLLVIWYLRQADQRRLLFWFLISLALLKAGNNLLEIVVGAVGSAATAYALGPLLKRFDPQMKFAVYRERLPAEVNQP